MAQATGKQDYEPRPGMKDYVLVSDKGHDFIDENGVRKVASKGDTVPLTDNQYANFKDKFVPAEQAPRIEKKAEKIARLKQELADAEEALAAEANTPVGEGDDDDDDAGVKQTGKPGEMKQADPSSAPKDVRSGGPEKSPQTEVPKDSSPPGSPSNSPTPIPGTGKPA